MPRDDLDRSGEIRVRRIADPRVTTTVARKGAGKSGGTSGGTTTPHQPQEMPNTLQSRATARVAELLSEGPVYGLRPPPGANGSTIWQSVYLDGTPVADEAGNFQFNIRDGHFRYGFPSQDPIPGYSQAEAVFSVGVECEFAIPVERALNVPTSAVRYIVRIPALYEQETDGDVVNASVAYAFDIRVDGGLWTNVVTERIDGKTMSPYERAVRVQLPPQTSTLQIRIERLDPPPPSNRQNDIWFASYTEIEDSVLSYDDSCIAAVTISAEEFQSIPSRAYLLDGLMIDIPTNYDGRTHGYTGDWNGEFYVQWTNNPAWILYALMTNKRWGLGNYFDRAIIDKWSFYECAVNNDGWMANFNEVRFTCNVVINTRQDAFTVLQAVASNMLAQLYYANGTLYLVQDKRITDPVRLFGPADVEKGLFDYASADVRSRFTAVAVTWNDPSDKYEPAVELVQDPTLVAQQGYKETSLNLFGCTSRGQAIRHGRWLIYTSQFETETCTFRTGLENADLRPGDMIFVSDPSRVGARITGRTRADTGVTNTLALDVIPPEIISAPTSFQLYVTVGSAAIPDEPHAVIVVTIASIADAANGVLNVTGKTMPVPAGSVWLARSSDVEPRPWRVTSIADRNLGAYEVTCTEYHVEKFDYMESGVLIPQPPFSLIPTGPLVAPINLAYREFIYLDGSGVPQFGVVMSWSPSPDPRVQRYQLEMSGPAGDYRKFAQIGGVAQEVLAMRQGEWTAVLLAFDNIGRRTQPVTLVFTPIGLSERPLPPSALFVSAQQRVATLNWVPTGEIDIVYYWVKWHPSTDGSATWSTATTSINMVDRNTTQITTPTRSGTFMVKTIDSLGQESVAWATAILVEQITDDVHLEDIIEQPDWGGHKGGTATAWNPNDKAAPLALSNNNLTATGTGAAQQSARATASIGANERRFYSFVAVAEGSNRTGAGFANAMANLNGYIGVNLNGFQYLTAPFATVGGVFYNNANVATVPGNLGDVIDWAINTNTMRAWVRVNGGNWNGSAGNSPETGVGGINIASTPLPLYPALTVSGAPGQLVANFGGPFTYPPPANYEPVWSTIPPWHVNLGALMMPPPAEPEPVDPGVFQGHRLVRLNQTPTRLGTYSFEEDLDLGLVSSVSAIAVIEAHGIFQGVTMSTWTPLASAVPLAAGVNNTISTWVPLAMAQPLAMGTSDQWDAHIDVRQSQDGTTYDEWTPLKSAVLTGRKFQFQLHGLIYDLATTLRVDRCEVWIEIPLRNISGSDVALDGTGHLTVVYAVPFLARPTVQITARQTVVAGGNIVLTASNANQFTVEHRNAAGAPVAGGSIDYFVQGYGGGIPLTTA